MNHGAGKKEVNEVADKICVQKIAHDVFFVTYFDNNVICQRWQLETKP